MNSEDDERFASGDDPESATRKSERKRQREKQRRSDLANAFDELASLLAKIEPGQGDVGAVASKKRRRRSGDVADLDTSGEQGSGLTRLDLIGRAIEALKKLHKENQELKQSADQQGYRARGGSDDKVRPNLRYRYGTCRVSCCRRRYSLSNFTVRCLKRRFWSWFLL